MFKLLEIGRDPKSGALTAQPRGRFLRLREDPRGIICVTVVITFFYVFPAMTHRHTDLYTDRRADGPLLLFTGRK